MSGFADAPMPAWQLTPPRLAMLGIVLLLGSVDVRVAIAVLGAQPPGVDWSPLWAAARLAIPDPDRLYDFARITRAQQPLIGLISGVRPFVYPPSALPIFAPFALLPVLPSCAAWIAVTGAFYLAASSRLTASWWMLLLLPPVVLAALAGQTSFLLGGMTILGLLMLERRPACAGLVLGIATAIKPQLLILVPAALLIAQNWRALVCWGVGGAAMLLLSLALYGRDAWFDWLAVLPRFQALFENSPTLIDDAITPYALAQRLGIAGWWVIAAAAIPAGAALWATFRRDGSPSDRLIALVGGALLLSPYAMEYELALLAPALVAGARNSLRGAALLLAFGLSVPFGFGLWGVAMAMLSLARPRRRPDASPVCLSGCPVHGDPGPPAFPSPPAVIR